MVALGMIVMIPSTFWKWGGSRMSRQAHPPIHLDNNIYFCRIRKNIKTNNKYRKQYKEI